MARPPTNTGHRLQHRLAGPLALLIGSLCGCGHNELRTASAAPQSDSAPTTAPTAAQPSETPVAGTAQATRSESHAAHPGLRSGSHPPIVAEARGHEFQWQFFTIGPDRKPGTGDETCLGNDLPVPPDTLVTLILTSDDYIYTLNAPDGRVAAAVPDLVHTIQFRSPSGGRHEFRTDPMCGLRYFHDDVLGTMSIIAPVRDSQPDTSADSTTGAIR